MNCEKCKTKLSNEEIFRHGGHDYCEDCYVDIVSVPKTCDPMKVRSAKLTREKFNQKGVEGLLPIQKKLYKYLEENGKATRDEIATEFQLDQKELEKHFAVLRHCELVRGFKQNDQVYLTLMSK